MYKNLWQKNWLRRSIIGPALMLIFLALLPVAIQQLMIQQIEKLGADKVAIENIDINLFTGRFKLEQLTIKKGDNPALKIAEFSLDLAMLELLQSKIVVEDTHLLGVNLVVARDKNSQLTINGFALPKSAEKSEEKKQQRPGESIKFALLKSQIVKSEITFREPGFSTQVGISKAQINNLVSWRADDQAEIKLDAKIDNAPVNVSAELRAFAHPSTLVAKLSIQQLALKKFGKFAEPFLKQLDGQVTFESQIKASFGDTIKISASSQLEIEQLKFAYKSLQHTSQHIRFNGENTFNSSGNKVNLNGDFGITKSRSVMDQGYQLLTFDRLTAKKMTLANNKLDLAAIDLSALNFAHNTAQQPFVQWKNLQLQDVTYALQENQLEINKIELAKPRIEITLNKQGAVNQVEQLLQQLDALANKAQNNQAAEEPVKQNSVAGKKPQPFGFQIDSFELTEKGDVHYRDHKVEPNFEGEFELAQLMVGPIATDQLADITALINQGEFSHISIEGKGLLLNPKQQLDLTTKISRFELPQISSYSTQVMGYGMKSGVLDSEIQLKLDQQKIDANIQLALDHLDVIETDKETAAHMASAAGMSINLAISTLKNDQQLIELELPIKGDINAPDFDLSKVMNKALGIAMQSASLSYLKHILQPFGTLLTVYDLVDGVANRVSLAPVLFKDNSLELLPDQQLLLLKIQTLLNDRPDLKLKTCGISNLHDRQLLESELVQDARKREAKKMEKAGIKTTNAKKKIIVDPEKLQTELLKLADNRSAKIKTWLVKQAGIKAVRILGCLSEIRLDKDEPAAVNLSI